jgi:hypothetical protein
MTQIEKLQKAIITAARKWLHSSANDEAELAASVQRYEAYLRRDVSALIDSVENDLDGTD